MSSNQLGKLFTVTSFGESHGQVVGVVVDGCPAGLPLTEADLQIDLDRRRPGQSNLATTRCEYDRAEILSGTFGGRTTGAPLCFVVRNQNADSFAYEALKHTPRPGHADYSSRIKYGGYADYRGGVHGRLENGVGVAVLFFCQALGNHFRNGGGQALGCEYQYERVDLITRGIQRVAAVADKLGKRQAVHEADEPYKKRGGGKHRRLLNE